MSISFRNWPSTSRCWPSQLIKAGFVYTGEDHIVKCLVCGYMASVHSWHSNEAPAQAHARNSPGCSFVLLNKLTPSVLNNKEYLNSYNEFRNRNLNQDEPTSTTSNTLSANRKNNDTYLDKIAADRLCDIKTKEQYGQITVNNNNRTDYNSQNIDLTKDISNIHLEDANGIDSDAMNEMYRNHGYKEIVANPAVVTVNGQSKTITTGYAEGRSLLSDNCIPEFESQTRTSNVITTALEIETPISTMSECKIRDIPEVYSQSCNQQYNNTFKPRDIVSSQSLRYEVVFRYPQFQTIEERIYTFISLRWKYTHTQQPEILATSGFFYTGEEDIVRCFCCDLGLAEWNHEDDSWVEHARHGPNCWYLKNEKGQRFIDDVQLQWKQIYNPKHPQYETNQARLGTYKGLWRTDIEQTPEILADAGFFYTGEDDVVRCHYCDGGLRNWEVGDVPWEEHARWFPSCKYVMKAKGKHFVDTVRTKMEQEDLKRYKSHEIEESLENHPYVKKLEELSFSKAEALTAVQEFLKIKGENFQIEDLVELIFQQKSEKALTQSPGQTIKDPQTLLAVNKQLKAKMMCHQCKTEEISILFTNCGHRVVCEECSTKMDMCIICKKPTKNKIKTYLA